MTTLCKFVDSISTTAGVRFDFNAGPSQLQKQGTEIGPPTLNRGVSMNMMSDGGHVGSSVYGMRQVTLTALIRGSAETAAATLQTLMREIDRETNTLLWHPQGASKPVFLKTYRSPPEALDMTDQAVGIWRVRLVLLADPHARGTRETLGPFTVNNDPAAGSNGCFFDVAGVIGDVMAPCVIQDTSRSIGNGWLAVRRRGTPADLVWWVQAEAGSPFTAGLTDTTNPGAGPDAAMSGTGTNNFLRTSFATATLQPRVSWAIDQSATTTAQRRAMRGTYRVLVVVRRSGSTSDIAIQLRDQDLVAIGAKVAVPKTAVRQVVDLGLFTESTADRDHVGYSDALNPTVVDGLTLYAERTSGAETLDWDLIMLLPADERQLIWLDRLSGSNVNNDLLVDGVNQSISRYGIAAGGDPFAGTAALREAFGAAGGFPELAPNVTNRFYLLSVDGGPDLGGVMTKSESNAISVHYWPQYLYIRPSAS